MIIYGVYIGVLYNKKTPPKRCFFIESMFYFFPFLCCKPSTITRSGEATKIEEYVPKNIPTIRTSAKFFVATGPKKNNAIRTKITVSDVFIERTNV